MLYAQKLGPISELICRHYTSGNTPPSFFGDSSKLPKTYDQIQQTSDSRIKAPSTLPDSAQDGSSGDETKFLQAQKNSAGPQYTEFFRGLAYIALTGTLIYILADQRKQLDRYKKQLAITRKAQKEMILQMQKYKKKIAADTVKKTQRHTMTEGKMQMHIAILRQQLKDHNVEPVTVDQALDEFNDKVKMTTTKTSVTLWVPGESSLKSLIPDPNEYAKRV